MKNDIINYNSKLVELAKKLRKKSTLSEKLLWNHLKGRMINGYDFDRQKPIDNYIIDFYFKELRLAVEIDGVTHNEKMTNDRKRQDKLESLGIKFLRFTDKEVVSNAEGVASYIKDWIKGNY